MDKLADITAQGWIMAYFIRSDGERFLLGTGAYDFKSDLQHFQPNTMANDIVELQGTDGQLIAGQVRRSATQSFDGYVGDSTQNRERIEELRRDFLMFFRKNFFYKTVYIYPNGTAIQRKRGYLVDAPSVPELYQFFPEYHVALNYEDPNYYEYAEDAQGDEIFANILAIALSSARTGGLVWDAIGAVSYGTNWQTPATASGSSFQITGIEGAPLTLTEITGNATQDGTPTPDAPVAVQTVSGEQVVEITGKNLINENGERSSQYIDGSGNFATGVANGYVNQQLPTQPNTAYTFSASAKSAQQVYIRIAEYKADGSFIKRNLIDSLTQTITTDAECYIIKTCIDVSTGNHFTNPQLELGSTATAYEPYQGQEFEVNLGKNLFDKNNANILNGGITTKIENAPLNRTLWIPCEPNTTYTVQKRNDGNTNRFTVATTSITPTFEVVVANKIEDRDASSITYTTSASARYLCVQYFRTAETAITEQQVLDSIQIEKGSIATSYAPYFTPIELAKIGDYQDRIYKQDGKWYIEKQVGKYILDGSSDENWYLSQNALKCNGLNAPTTQTYGQGYAPNNTGYNLKNTSLVAQASNLGVTIRADQALAGTKDSGVGLSSYVNGGGTTDAIYIAKGSYTVATWKTLIQATPLICYYALATPTTTEITDSTLLTQLNFIANLYGGTNNIMLVGTGAQGEIGVEYMTEVDMDGAGYEWEAGGDGGETTITLDAVEAVRPVWQVIGPATDPTLTNITTGETITFTGTVPAGQTLTVDMDARTATMAGANVFQYIMGDWLRLEPGNNRMSYTATGTTEPSTLSWNGVVG